MFLYRARKPKKKRSMDKGGGVKVEEWVISRCIGLVERRATKTLTRRQGKVRARISRAIRFFPWKEGGGGCREWEGEKDLHGSLDPNRGEECILHRWK